MNAAVVSAGGSLGSIQQRRDDADSTVLRIRTLARTLTASEPTVSRFSYANVGRTSVERGNDDNASQAVRGERLRCSFFGGALTLIERILQRLRDALNPAYVF